MQGNPGLHGDDREPVANAVVEILGHPQLFFGGRQPGPLDTGLAAVSDPGADRAAGDGQAAQRCELDEPALGAVTGGVADRDPDQREREPECRRRHHSPGRPPSGGDEGRGHDGQVDRTVVAGRKEVEPDEQAGQHQPELREATRQDAGPGGQQRQREHRVLCADLTATLCAVVGEERAHPHDDEKGESPAEISHGQAA